LETFDGYMQKHDSRKAAKLLPKLRKNARSSTQWLSIAKRYFQLSDISGMESSVTEALSIIPGNETLTALLLHTLILQNKSAEASRTAALLLETRFAPLSAYAILSSNDWRSLDFKSIPAWKIAAEETGSPAAWKNAALASAVNGLKAEAVGLLEYSGLSGAAAEDSGYDELYSLLCYDSAFYERVGEGSSPASLRLAGDASWLLKDVRKAENLWLKALRSAAESDPSLLFTISVVSEDESIAKTYLEQALDADPAYFPALSQYVRNSSDFESVSLLDPLEAKLYKQEITTREIRRKLAHAPATAEQAAARLERALSVIDRDPRIEAESIRFEFRNAPDVARYFSSLWTLLEKYPNEPEIQSWTGWCFASRGDMDSALSVLMSEPEFAHPFWKGVAASLRGDLDSAETNYSLCADDAYFVWPALANRALVRERLKKYPEAIEDFSLAADIAESDATKSVLHYQAARMLYLMRQTDRASSILGYAIQLDSENYQARQLLDELEKIK
ncbi:MAG: hypothetical protein JXP39_05145, partial [Spirochaetales bacterium]|nr:hypothetical protein [Spirochaetales bacterium]